MLFVEASVASASYQNQPITIFNPEIKGVVYDKIKFPLPVVWKHKLSQGGNPSTPIVGDGKVFIGSTDGHLYAIDAYKGTTKWMYTAGAGLNVYTPAIDTSKGIVIFACSDNNVYGIQSSSGKCLWKQSIDQPPQTWQAPLVDHGSVYIVTKKFWATPYIYSIDTATGRINWRRTVNVISTYDVWDEAYYPAVYNGILYLSGRCDNYWYGWPGASDLQALYAINGTLIWSIQTDAITSIPAVDSTNVYVGTQGYSNYGPSHVFAFDKSNGQTRWSFNSKESFWASPIVYNNTIFIGGNSGVFWAIKTIDGTQKWEFTRGDSPIYSTPTINDKIIFFASTDRNVYAIDSNSGDYLWSYTANASIVPTQAIANNFLYVSSEDGYVSAFKIKHVIDSSYTPINPLYTAIISFIDKYHTMEQLFHGRGISVTMNSQTSRIHYPTTEKLVNTK